MTDMIRGFIDTDVSGEDRIRFYGEPSQIRFIMQNWNTKMN